MTEVVVDQVAERPLDASLPDAVSRRGGTAWARLVAETGRAGLVWFALAVVYTAGDPLTDGAIVAVTLAASIWLVTLRAASSPSVLLFGRTLSKLVGVGLGSILVALLNGTSVGLHLTWTRVTAAALGVLATATFWDWFVDRALAARKRVLFVGANEFDVLVAEDVRRCRQSGFEIVGCASTMDAARSGAAVRLVGMEELEQVVEAQHPDIVVLADEATFEDALDRLLDADAHVRVATLASFCEYAFGRVPIEHIGPAWFLSLVHLRQHVYTRRSKRIFDVVVAVIGLVLSAPVLAIMAALAKTTPGPVLHRQVRVGEGGRCFTVLKIRTMRCDAEQGGATFTCENDPRVTRTGRILRRSHLDELPQLWNVLRGDMSIVGPRPERPEFIEMIEEAVPFWNRRVLVKPGVTGWAQLLGDYASDCDGMAQKLSYDLWYLRHSSVLVDLAICVETVALQVRALLPRRPHAPFAAGRKGVGR
jgi:exopolysaccharide biosynthesis polyprenyl glycosylphosphotransferase